MHDLVNKGWVASGTAAGGAGTGKESVNTSGEGRIHGPEPGEVSERRAGSADHR